MRVLCSPLALGMQGSPLEPPAQQWGVWTCLTSRIWLPRRLVFAKAFAGSKHENWLVPLPLGRHLASSILRRMDAVDASAVSI